MLCYTPCCCCPRLMSVLHPAVVCCPAVTLRVSCKVAGHVQACSVQDNLMSCTNRQKYVISVKCPNLADSSPFFLKACLR
jgi:hypothetical protein